MSVSLAPRTQLPHGGLLVDRYAPGAEAAEFIDEAQELPSLTLTTRHLCDLELLANGGFSPLNGFMGEDDYRAVLTTMHLANGLVWTIPIYLAVNEEQARSTRPGQRLALHDAEGGIVGTLDVEEVYRADLETEAREVF